jgi:ABC-2 type transport system permease protein
MWSLLKRNIMELWRDPMTIGMGVGMPVALQLLFALISQRAPVPIFSISMITPAIVVFGFAFLLMFSGPLIAKDRQSAFLVRLLSTPLSSLDFILAYVLALAPLAVLQVLASFGAGALMGYQPGLAIFTTLILVYVPLAIACVGIGLTIGALCSEGQAQGLCAILINLIAFFCGAWIDLEMIGGAFAAIGYAMPFAHAVDAARALLAGASLAAVWKDVAIVIGYALVFFGSGVAAFAWKTRRA